MEINDDLMTRAKRRAARERVPLREIIERALESLQEYPQRIRGNIQILRDHGQRLALDQCEGHLRLVGLVFLE